VSPGSGARQQASGTGTIGGDLRTRVASAAVLGAIAIAGIWLGGIWFAAIVAAGAAIVHLEWTRVTGGSVPAAAPFTAAIVVATLGAGLGQVGPSVILAALALVAAAAISREPWRPAGVAYAAAFGISLVALRVSPDLGLAATAFLFGIVWATDTGAYFAGRLIGGPKLAPIVSPKKTWSGAIGGLVAAIVAGLVVAGLSGSFEVTPALVLVAIALSVVSQGGDLFESWVKRRYGVKDAGHIIPGHGGMMDRVDGLAFASVAAALIGLAHGGSQGMAGGLLSW
jgi:phosphatidate cytidylyltransferase